MKNQEVVLMQDDTDRVEINTLSGCLLRVFWLLIGNLALVICAYLIAVGGAKTFFEVSVFDVLFWAAALILGLSRYIDIRFFQGSTTDGVRATMAHFRVYCFWLWIISWGLWILAHAVAYSSI